MALVTYENSDSESEIKIKKEPNNDAENESEVIKRVKIQIPPLSTLKTEDEPPKKIIKTNHNFSSGLFNILPAPKNEPKEEKGAFDAAVLKEKNLVPRTVKIGKLNKVGYTEEKEIWKGNYFFFDADSKSKKKVVKKVPALDTRTRINVNSAKPVTKDVTVKNNTYFSKLVNEKSVVKVEKCEPDCSNTTEKVVDINSLEFKNDWKMTAIKEETSSVSSTSEMNEEEPSALSKRKHQITYLAYQAKKNEEQMKEQWALNKMTRKQTQAKYGF